MNPWQKLGLNFFFSHNGLLLCFVLFFKSKSEQNLSIVKMSINLENGTNVISENELSGFLACSENRVLFGGGGVEMAAFYLGLF